MRKYDISFFYGKRHSLIGVRVAHAAFVLCIAVTLETHIHFWYIAARYGRRRINAGMTGKAVDTAVGNMQFMGKNQSVFVR